MGKPRRERLAEEAEARRAGRRRKKPGRTANCSFPRLAGVLDELALVGGFAIHVSEELAGEPTTRAGALASMLHGKMCAHARTIGAVCESSMLDHSALMSLARMMMEAMSMHGYLTEPVSEEEWELRHLVLMLHDTENRINLVRARGDVGGLESLRQGRAELQTALQRHPHFLLLDKERQEKILRGAEMFVVGMRRVAKLAVGWDSDTFNALYSYFSAHTHSSPMSFMRTRDHGIDYYFPGDAQLSMAELAINVATACLRRVTLRQLDSSPGKIDQFQLELLEEFRKEDSAASFFAAGSSSQARPSD